MSKKKSKARQYAKWALRATDAGAESIDWENPNEVLRVAAADALTAIALHVTSKPRVVVGPPGPTGPTGPAPDVFTSMGLPPVSFPTATVKDSLTVAPEPVCQCLEFTPAPQPEPDEHLGLEVFLKTCESTGIIPSPQDLCDECADHGFEMFHELIAYTLELRKKVKAPQPEPDDDMGGVAVVDGDDAKYAAMRYVSDPAVTDKSRHAAFIAGWEARQQQHPDGSHLYNEECDCLYCQGYRDATAEAVKAMEVVQQRVGRLQPPSPAEAEVIAETIAKEHVLKYKGGHLWCCACGWEGESDWSRIAYHAAYVALTQGAVDSAGGESKETPETVETPAPVADQTTEAK